MTLSVSLGNEGLSSPVAAVPAVSAATDKAGFEFPAHLAPIDRFLLDDDVPRHPMTYVIQMECDGAFKREAFEIAFNGAVDRHPHTRAHIGPGERGFLSWVDPQGERPVIDWGDATDPIEIPDGEAIDIRNNVGLRVWIRQDHERSLILFQWHHSVTDGVGAFCFMGDILALYDQQLGGQKSKLLTLDPGLLKERRDKMVHSYTEEGSEQARSAVWRQFREVFKTPATPLGAPSEVDAATFPGFRLHTFSREETATLRGVADRAHVMLNDILLHSMFTTLRDWNARYAWQGSERPLRIMMPTNLRDSSETEMPAANMVGYTFISRSATDCDRPDKLLRDIATETAQIKHAHTGKGFIDAITAAELFPLAIPALLRSGKCLATGVLTNNGDPARRMNARLPRKGGLLTAGNVTVTRFSGVPPMREGTHATVAAMTYGRQLTVNARCDPTVMGDSQSSEFLDLYVERLCRMGGLRGEETHGERICLPMIPDANSRQAA